MPSMAKRGFEINKKDIKELWRIHEEVAGSGAGRKHGVDVLNRAAIVFVAACWESFVEDLALQAFDFMLMNVSSANDIPVKVRNLATRPIFDSKDSRRVWDLAGAGWRNVLIAHKGTTVDHWLGTFHTPKAQQVNTLFEELLGIQKLTSHWHWQGMSVSSAQKKLNQYVAMRGNIAHRTEHNATVYKSSGADFLGHVEHLVNTTDATVRQHLLTVCGSAPW